MRTHGARPGQRATVDAMSAKTTSASKPASKSRVRAGRLAAGELLVLAGVIVSTFGVAIAMLPGGYSPFGPVKALVLLFACAYVAAGFAFQPELPIAAIRRTLAQRGAWPGLGLVGLACIATLTSIDPSQSLVGHYPEYQGLLLLLASALAALGAYSLAEKDVVWRALGRARWSPRCWSSAYAIVQFVGVDPVTLRARLRGAPRSLDCSATPRTSASSSASRSRWSSRGRAASAGCGALAAWTAVGAGGVTLALCALARRVGGRDRRRRRRGCSPRAARRTARAPAGRRGRARRRRPRASCSR